MMPVPPKSAIPEGDSAVSAAHTRWMGVAKKFVLKLSVQMVIRIFGLLSQVLPVLKEWRSFNEFDYMDMLDVSTSYDQAQLVQSRSGAASTDASPKSNTAKWDTVTVNDQATHDQAYQLLRRAVLAQIQCELSAFSGRQDSTDPGDEWLQNCGTIMAEQVRWAEVVLGSRACNGQDATVGGDVPSAQTEWEGSSWHALHGGGDIVQRSSRRVEVHFRADDAQWGQDGYSKA